MFQLRKRVEKISEQGTIWEVSKKHINNRGYNKYLRIIEGKAIISIDMEAFEKDTAWDGIKGYVTNTISIRFRIL